MSQPMTLQCPVCGTIMEYQVHDFYLCPVCRHELWPPMSDEEREFWNAEALWRDEQRYKQSVSEPGSGSRSSGRNKRRRQPKGDWRPWEV